MKSPRSSLLFRLGRFASVALGAAVLASLVTLNHQNALAAAQETAVIPEPTPAAKPDSAEKPEAATEPAPPTVPATPPPAAPATPFAPPPAIPGAKPEEALKFVPYTVADPYISSSKAAPLVVRQQQDRRQREYIRSMRARGLLEQDPVDRKPANPRKK